MLMVLFVVEVVVVLTPSHKHTIHERTTATTTTTIKKIQNELLIDFFIFSLKK